MMKKLLLAGGCLLAALSGSLHADDKEVYHPSPFEAGRAIGTNISSGISQFTEGGVIERILDQASKSGNPEDIDNLMVEILKRVSPKNQPAAIKLLQDEKNNRVSKMKLLDRENALETLGYDKSLATLSESEFKEFIKKEDDKAAKNKAKNKAMGMVKRQRELLAGGNIGPALGVPGSRRKNISTMSAQGRSDRAEFELLGKALITYASTLVIRNEKEFDIMSKGMFDPTAPRPEISGSLDGLERIIGEGGQRGGAFQEELTEKDSPPPPPGKQTKRLSLPEIFQSSPAISGEPE